MRNHIHCLDTNTMPWEQGEMVGLRTKLLSHDPETGARTALQCITPDEGYNAPSVAHYHPGNEELFVLKGEFSFNQQDWLHRKSYCFHPAGTVHGFKSTVNEESWFLSRVEADLEFGFVENPEKLEPYPLDGKSPKRPVRIVLDPEQDEEWDVELGPDGKPVLERLILSKHPDTGEGAMLVRFLPGWVSPHGPRYHSHYKEAFVLEGELLGDDGTVWTEGCYTYMPAGTVEVSKRSPKGALVYVNFGGPLDFIPATSN